MLMMNLYDYVISLEMLGPQWYIIKIIQKYKMTIIMNYYIILIRKYKFTSIFETHYPSTLFPLIRETNVTFQSSPVFPLVMDTQPDHAEDAPSEEVWLPGNRQEAGPWGLPSFWDPHYVHGPQGELKGSIWAAPLSAVNKLTLYAWH